MVRHVTTPAAALLARLPGWVSLVTAANPGPMTLDGTNTWVVRAPGADEALVIDPGPLLEEHLAEVAGGGPVHTVVATHHHPDHVAGLPRLCELTGARAHRPGPEPDTWAGVSVATIATPGHTADSVCFLAEHGDERVVFAGDTILGRGTTVVAYPDGDLAEYLTSLRVLARFEGVPVLPGHGPALADCAAAARFYLEHRLARLEQVRTARERGAATPAEVVAAAYGDVDRSLWPAAELSVRAQLAYLDAAGESSTPSERLDRP